MKKKFKMDLRTTGCVGTCRYINKYYAFRNVFFICAVRRLFVKKIKILSLRERFESFASVENSQQKRLYLLIALA